MSYRSAMRILDLFSGAGGAAAGYARVWPAAEIVGVDIVPQPNYPFTFIEADAMEFPLDGFDFIHASPPCHDHTQVARPTHNRTGATHGTGWMLEAIVGRLRANGVPWVVENVDRAPMPPAASQVRLCGSSFGLDLHRHRWFISDCSLTPIACDHSWQTPRFQSLKNVNRKRGKLARVVGVHGRCQYPGERELRKRAMQIDWMSDYELTQAIPPAFTEHIGRSLDWSLDF